MAADATLSRSIRRLQWLSIGWMCVELFAGAFFGLRARSVALTAFSADSGIELLSAALVLFRLGRGEQAERRTANVAAALLYLLAPYIVVAVTLSLIFPRLRPEPTTAGVLLLAAASILMPVFAWAKKRLARRTGIKALSADAAQANVCAWLSWISLAALGLNRFFHLPWADSLGSLALLPLLLHEANEARQGHLCQCG
jgi:divalent metal cation (Fe/Co/Zn/Cd) transporter